MSEKNLRLVVIGSTDAWKDYQAMSASRVLYHRQEKQLYQTLKRIDGQISREVRKARKAREGGRRA